MSLVEKTKEMINVNILDEETTRMIERMVVLRVATKHVNLWVLQLEMKKKGNQRVGWVDEV